ncbi:EAL domain-containing protein (putative c-di-GMP-specific phosphodiesterase class I) [Alteromonadaceae bacterium 2753L.S.0a.02]|nr:EAL domain-containing protein (putative c-di-GMP-specific phosphodiesterase class I) [Alteromonadaceae bacterium 2753L.S.0a.02]
MKALLLLHKLGLTNLSDEQVDKYYQIQSQVLPALEASADSLPEITDVSLKKALKNEQLSLRYFPRAFANGDLACHQVCVVWCVDNQHADYEIVFRQFDYDEALNFWILEQAITEYRHKFSAQESTLRPYLSIQIGSSCLYSQQFLARFDALIHQYDIGADDRLELLVSENALTATPELTESIFAGLRKRGVSVVISNFGAGYSGVAYLKRLPIDAILIDRAFIAEIDNPQSEAIVDAVISMSHHLGLKVIADGVDTEAQWHSLANKDCDMLQGRFITESFSARESANQLAEASANIKA